MVLLSLNMEKEYCLNKQEQFPTKFATFSVQSFDNNDFTFVLKYLPSA